MTAFPRSSDLVRTSLKGVSSKETRKKRGIIKPFIIHPHASNLKLCPVKAFVVLRDHPDLQTGPANSQLFIQNPQHPSTYLG
ncbi:hypothetical protein BD408DRAFT_340938 [Parasitella parasitica]|nr:hypothetical protein BD408DRAFT_340938 [Parasitella parasitica]